MYNHDFIKVSRILFLHEIVIFLDLKSNREGCREQVNKFNVFRLNKGSVESFIFITTSCVCTANGHPCWHV